MSAPQFALTNVERPTTSFSKRDSEETITKVLAPLEHVAFMSRNALCEYTAYFLGWEYITKTNQTEGSRRYGIIEFEGWKAPGKKAHLHSPKADDIPPPQFSTSKLGDVLEACALLGWEPKIFTRESEGELYYGMGLKPLPDKTTILDKKLGEAILRSFLIAAWTVQDAAEAVTTPTPAELLPPYPDARPRVAPEELEDWKRQIREAFENKTDLELYPHVCERASIDVPAEEDWNELQEFMRQLESPVQQGEVQP